MSRIHIALLEVLARRRMKMAELSRRTGIAYSTINNFANERIERVDLKTLARICSALDCQPGDLLECVPDGEVKPTTQKAGR
jgi:putative transcriptional regulator